MRRGLCAEDCCVTIWPKGSKLEAEDFLAKHRDLVKLLRAGQSIRNAAKIAGKGVSTVQRVKAALDAAA